MVIYTLEVQKILKIELAYIIRVESDLQNQVDLGNYWKCILSKQEVKRLDARNF